MTEAGVDGVLRRKIAAAKAVQSVGGPGADRSWRLSLARAASEELNLALDVSALRVQTQSLAEVLELPFAGALIAVLQGPCESTGLIVVTFDVLAALIEVQTLGKVGTQPLDTRKPTRTDAAMVVPFLDAALTTLETELVQEADLIWAGGFRYASFLDDPRPLGLLMEDFGYRVMTAEVSLGLGARKGTVYMALPAKGRGRAPAYTVKPLVDEAIAAQGFSQALAEQVEASGCVLDAVLSRIHLPLADVMGFEVGDVVPLGRAAIDRLRLNTLAGAHLVQGKLGQHRGMRAIRLALAPEEQGAGVQAERQGKVTKAGAVSAQVTHSARDEAITAQTMPMAQAG